LGQYFLREDRIVHEILKRSRFKRSDRVLEIGPGLGALTIPLSGLVHEVWAVEKDSRLVSVLRKKLSDNRIKNVKIISEDILKLDFRETGLLYPNKLKVIGNLPYAISSPFLDKLIKNRWIVNNAILMFQLEFAKRLVASPGSKDYGALSVLIQYFAQVSPVLEVSNEEFYPKPKVNSMVLELDLEKPHYRRAENEDDLKVVVKGAFAHRRKTLFNSLRRAFNNCINIDIQRALERCKIDPHRRAETLDIDDFLCLACALGSQLDKSSPQC
jgi:16S rRNA (adenine1518-N6/adenine1519-N6)-dimethyltransferase